VKAERHLDLRFLAGLGVFVAALVVRLVALNAFAQTPLFDSPTMDMLYHHQWAQDIVAGRGALYSPFFRAPLYAYFLAGIYAVFGSGPWASALVGCLLGSISALFTFVLGLRVCGRAVGFAAGLIVAFWGPLAFFDSQLVDVSLVVFLNLAALLLLVPPRGVPSARRLAAGGLCIGLSAIARPTILLFAVLYAVWFLAARRPAQSGPRRIHALTFLALVMLPVVPVTLYNFSAAGQPVAIATYSGLNFYIGNHLGSDGTSAKLPGARQDWWGMMDDAQIQAEQEAGRPLAAGEQSGFWWRKAGSEILASPVAWAALMARKTIFLLQGIELSNNLDFYYFAHRSTLLAFLVPAGPIFFPWGLFIVPAFAGLLAGLRNGGGPAILALFALSSAAAVILFFVTERYRLPLVPVVAIFAATGLAFLWRQVRGTGWRSRGAVALLVIPGLLLANVDWFGHAPHSEAPGLFAMASAYEREMLTASADRYYRAAIESDPTFVQAYNDLGLLQVDLGEFEPAIQTLTAGAAVAPNDPRLRYNLAYAYLVAGRADSAIPLLRTVVQAEPDNLEALNNLGTACNLTARFDSAAACYRRLIDRDPGYPTACLGLGWALAGLGQGDSARVYLRASADREQNYVDSWYQIAQSWIGERQGDSALAALYRCRERLLATESPLAAEVEAQIDSLDGF
jgi:Tfp pilus assembly protein PilF